MVAEVIFISDFCTTDSNLVCEGKNLKGVIMSASSVDNPGSGADNVCIGDDSAAWIPEQQANLWIQVK